jgi:hypothetical protein
MRKLLLILAVSIIPLLVYCWGFYGHKSINRIAVYTLPTELAGFYKQHIEYVTSHAVDPDMRRYAVKEEAPRHYIDIDHYGENPFDNVPKKWDEAVEKFTEDTLQAYGIVPWHVERMYFKLVSAFKKKDIPYILKTSADIGHYIADAHVPLHTTENYNGQLTNQKGIHGFWESRLPELYADDYDFFIGKAHKIDNPLNFIWDEVQKSNAAVDSVLHFERDLTAEYPSDRKYAFEEKGATMMKTYSRDFSHEYHLMLDGMVERRMRSAIIAVGSFWYSAWVEAGQPDLNTPLTAEQVLQLEQDKKELEAQYNGNKILGREHED